MAMAKESMAKTLREIADALESEVVKYLEGSENFHHQVSHG